jgi:hypothetical protein
MTWTSLSSETMHGTTGQGLEAIARTGYAVNGVLYIVLGIIAVEAALGGGAATGSSGALRMIASQPLGRVLLAATAIGIAAHVLWKLFLVIADPQRNGYASRAFELITAGLYATLGFAAGRAVLDGSKPDGGESAPHWTAEVMRQPLGKWLVVAAGAGIFLYGLYQIYKSYAVDMNDELRIQRLGGRGRQWVVGLGRIGFAARGIVLAVVGGFLVDAALRSNPGQARGIGGALRTLESQPYGPWLLAGVAAGLAAFGVLQIVRARYVRFPAG